MTQGRAGPAGSGPGGSHIPALDVPEDRVDGVAKVTGAARFAADRAMPGMLWARFLASPMPHAAIRSVDAGRARTMPGVRAVLTGEDARDLYFGRRLLDRPVIAWDRVRFVGDRLAAVAAETPEQAEAALATIAVDLEALEPVLDAEASLAAGAPILHEHPERYAFLDGKRPPTGHPNIQGGFTIEGDAADLEAVFAAAPHVFTHTYRTPRQHHGYLEPHATLVWIDDGDLVHVVTTNKAPFRLRAQMAASLGLAAERIVVETGYIGGDFGGKGYSIDEYACYLLARATGRPVKAVTPYAEEIGQVNVRHAAVMRLRTAVDADGRLLAHSADILLDGGAYASAKPLAHLAVAGAADTLAPYRVPHVRIVARTVYTNTVPAGHMRAPGQVQTNFAGESHLDEIARALGQDPLAFRLRNAARPGEVGATGARFREARGAPLLEVVRREMEWGSSLPAGRGRGVALGLHHVGAGRLPLTLLIHHDGRLEITTGLPEQGGGVHTVIRRVMAAAAVPESIVAVRQVATSGTPPDPGVGGSWATHLASRATAALAAGFLAWLDERLPGALPAAPAGATLRDGRVVDAADGSTLAALDTVLARLVPRDAPVELSTVYEGGHREGEDDDFDFAACAVEVEVDRETGAFAIRDALLVVDAGTIINPVAHRGQAEGGFVFGLGGAVMEGLVLDGGVVTNLSLADARLPTPGDVPPLRLVVLPTDVGPGAFGAKAIGEAVNPSVAPAVANAIADAVGARLRELPLSAEDLLRAMHRA